MAANTGPDDRQWLRENGWRADYDGYEDGLHPNQIKMMTESPLVSDPDEGGTPRASLVDAIWSEDIRACQQLLDAHPELINTTLKQWAHLKGRNLNRAVDSPVGYASAVYGHRGDDYLMHIPPLVFASLLLRWKELGSDDQSPTPTNVALINLLVERGAHLNGLSDWHQTWKSIILAEVVCVYDSPEVMAILIEAGAETVWGGGCETYGRHWTLLQLAARQCQVKSLAHLLEQGVSMAPRIALNSDDDDHPFYSNDGTPLNAAVDGLQPLAVEFLLRNGASQYLEIANFLGKTPLASALEPVGPHDRNMGGPEDGLQYENRESIVRLLVDVGAQFQETQTSAHDQESSVSPSLLGQLVVWGTPEIIRYAIEKGCSDPKQLQSALLQASEAGNVGGVRVLLECGADANEQDYSGQNSLHWVMSGLVKAYKHEIIHLGWCDTRSQALAQLQKWPRFVLTEAMISHLLDRHADINHRDHSGNTPLHYVSDLLLHRIINFLIRNGADITVVNDGGRSIFHEFAIQDRLDRSRDNEELSGPDPDDWGWDDAESGQYSIPTTKSGLDFEELVTSLKEALEQQGSSVLNRLSDAGETALHIACRRMYIPMVSVLLRLGVDPNTLDLSGRTAIHGATAVPDWVKNATWPQNNLYLWLEQFSRLESLLVEAGARVGPEIDTEIGRVKREYEEKALQARRANGTVRGRGRGWGHGATPRGG